MHICIYIYIYIYIYMHIYKYIYKYVNLRFILKDSEFNKGG